MGDEHTQGPRAEPGSITTFDEARRAVRDGMDVQAAAVAVVRAMTPEERLWCLDGDQPTWAGLGDLGTGGYHRSPFPAARVERLGVPGFAFADGPRGCVVGNATAFPVAMARGATWDPELEERVGEAIGRELRAVGATLTGAVCTNVLRHPAWGRAQETYGEDPCLVGEMGAAVTRGLQRHVMACVKHFACNSMENARFSVDIEVDDVALHEVYLPHFRRIVDEGVASVMAAYNAVNGEWAGQSRALLTDVLRDEWDFEGFVISDWIFGLRDAATSLTAGLDVEMPYRMVRARDLPGAGAGRGVVGRRRPLGDPSGGHAPALRRRPRRAGPGPRRAGLPRAPRARSGGGGPVGGAAPQRAGRRDAGATAGADDVGRRARPPGRHREPGRRRLQRRVGPGLHDRPRRPPGCDRRRGVRRRVRPLAGRSARRRSGGGDRGRRLHVPRRG